MTEPTLMWTRSSFCADSACVEAAPVGGEHVAVRDSKSPEQPYLRFSRDEWSTFLDGIASGQYRDI
ncbi:hypothetical protein ACTI_79000 [Actinoplanes sp. OR16]|uniref:DUF397 domain-containing protein n=1 Tax=Actinoplanes sp. OR16 TaxID=946334 RepID=UPI000F6E7EE7|nr:DUF397 domain-containing protein [Actinoplanes sp. OR16]BBH71215.1 hypothetical protein ACTI_79000 [Actinoplanes sp. OR16]